MKKIMDLALNNKLNEKDKKSLFLEGMNEPNNLPNWLSNEDLEFFTKEFKKSGKSLFLSSIEIRQSNKETQAK